MWALAIYEYESMDIGSGKALRSRKRTGTHKQHHARYALNAAMYKELAQYKNRLCGLANYADGEGVRRWLFIGNTLFLYRLTPSALKTSKTN